MWRGNAQVLAGVFMVGAVSGLFGFVFGVGYATGQATMSDGTTAMFVIATSGLLAVFTALNYMILVRVIEFVREALRGAERRRGARGAGG